MHYAQTAYLKKQIKKYFNGGVVFDIGSKDINGSNRDLFKGNHFLKKYVGFDLSPGKNVNVVSHFADFEGFYLFEPPDLIISGEALEHDRRYWETLQKIVSVLKVGGTAIITAAGFGRPEHGTSRRHPGDSPDTNDYYMNLTMYHVYHCLKNLKGFEVVDVEETNQDIYFTILKNGNNPLPSLEENLKNSIEQFFDKKVDLDKAKKESEEHINITNSKDGEIAYILAPFNNDKVVYYSNQNRFVLDILEEYVGRSVEKRLLD